MGRRCFVVQVIERAGFRILDEYGCVPTLLDQTMIRTQVSQKGHGRKELKENFNTVSFMVNTARTCSAVKKQQ
ncbi:hypothetical protein Tco_0214393, partial [Tanacetum coccineum]